MDRLQIASSYHIIMVVSVFLTVTSALGDMTYMHPVGNGGGMLLHDVSYDTPDHAFLTGSPFGGGLGASHFGGGLVSSVDIGDTYYMPGISAAPSIVAQPHRGVIQAFPGSRSSYSRGITSRRYGGRRMRLYVV